MGGFEPSTPRLQITCSGQLSYIGNISSLRKKDCKDRNYLRFSKYFSIFFANLFRFAPGVPCTKTACFVYGLPKNPFP